MVIQRWQSVYLLLAIFAMVLVFFLPFGYVDAKDDNILEFVSLDYPILIVMNSLIIVLLLLDIFLYKNLHLQRLVAAILALLILISGVTSGIILTGNDSVWQIAWIGAPVGLVAAFILTLVARYRMGKDQDLLKSYDRIR